MRVRALLLASLACCGKGPPPAPSPGSASAVAPPPAPHREEPRRALEPVELPAGRRNELPTIVGAIHGRVIATSSDADFLYAADGKDSAPLPAHTDPGSYFVMPAFSSPVVAGELLYFTFIADHDQELWSTDGTAAGTRIVRDIAPGPASSFPHELTPVGDTLFFAAAQVETGVEVWKTDGTRDGTALVRDIVPGGLVLADGTQLVAPKDIDPTRAKIVADVEAHLRETSFKGPAPKDLVGGAHRLYFLVDDALWTSDGTEAGTTRVGTVPLVQDPRAAGDRWFAFTMLPPHELWTSDGKRVQKIATIGEMDDLLDHSAAVESQLYFTANGSLWRSDGTAAGTKKLAPVQADSLVAFRDHLYFGVWDSNALWRVDGDRANQVLELPVAHGKQIAMTIATPSWLFVVMTSMGGGPWSLWRTDGTLANTTHVGDFSATPQHGSRNFSYSEGWLYFGAATASRPFGIWRADAR